MKYFIINKHVLKFNLADLVNYIEFRFNDGKYSLSFSMYGWSLFGIML